MDSGGQFVMTNGTIRRQRSSAKFLGSQISTFCFFLSFIDIVFFILFSFCSNSLEAINSLFSKTDVFEDKMTKYD